jgi:glycosyltransferase involved in cell wall biosynthesis
VRAHYDLPERFVLSVGTLEPRKNLPMLVDAFADVADDDPGGATLVLAGKLGWSNEPLERRLEDPRLAGRVRRLGYVPRQHLPALYGGAAAFAYPSLEEGFGLPPLEAMACGAPVVSSTTSALVENLAGAAPLVDPTDRAALAEALRCVLTDEHEASRLRTAGRERAAGFTWAECARRHADAYRSVGRGAARTGTTARPTGNQEDS